MITKGFVDYTFDCKKGNLCEEEGKEGKKGEGNMRTRGGREGRERLLRSHALAFSSEKFDNSHVILEENNVLNYFKPNAFL